ncbi:MAG: hypothetical protein RR034_06250, partial [Bacteroidales bacterium]
MKNRNINIIILVLILFWGFALTVIYNKSKEQAGFIYAEIPKETLEFLKKIREGRDTHIDYDPTPKESDWSNSNNIGENSAFGLQKIEDDLFIVYYDRRDKEHAFDVIQYAHNAVKPLEELMGKYIYPEAIRGRKLPIYLATSSQQYDTIVSAIQNSEVKLSAKSAGVYLMTYSNMGVLTKGIVLNNEALWNDRMPSSYPEQILKHEMNHYVFFQSLDLSQNVKPYLWISEGLAEYFSRPGTLILNDKQKKILNTCTLQETFPDYESNYYGGNSLYQYMVKKYTIAGVKSFIQYIYNLPIEDAVLRSFGTDVTELATAWKQSWD